jgi:hypothetical protein
MDQLSALEAMGITMPTPVYLVGMILFSVCGYAAYRYGKKNSDPVTKWIGIALMLYTYVVSDTAMMYLVGVALCGAIYWLRRS